MAEGSSRGSLKRSFVEDDESDKPSEKRVRFPKGKKIRQGDYVIDSVDNDVPSGKEARLAAKDRSMRRAKTNAELLNDEINDLVPDIRKAEVQYKDNETFVDEGVSIEPFNLDKEREDGYFDENGNYVEYIDQNEIKDAWLDNIDVYQKYTGKASIPESNDDKPRDLTTDELAAINRRIADVLEPGETVLRGLRRLKGTSADKKLKMSAETKQLFDQLTDDAAKLMDNGDYNVYEEKQESFQREAEGYEKLAAARNNGVSGDLGREKSDDLFDIFADDDGTAGAENSASAGSASVSVQSSESMDPFLEAHSWETKLYFVAHCWSGLQVEPCKMIMYMMCLLAIITAAVWVIIMIRLQGIIAALYQGNGIRILKNQGHMMRSLKKLRCSVSVETDGAFEVQFIHNV